MCENTVLFVVIMNIVLGFVLVWMIVKIYILDKKERDTLAKMEQAWEILREGNPILDEVMKQDSKKNDK